MRLIKFKTEKLIHNSPSFYCHNTWLPRYHQVFPVFALLLGSNIFGTDRAPRIKTTKILIAKMSLTFYGRLNLFNYNIKTIRQRPAYGWVKLFVRDCRNGRNLLQAHQPRVEDTHLPLSWPSVASVAGSVSLASNEDST